MTIKEFVDSLSKEETEALNKILYNYIVRVEEKHEIYGTDGIKQFYDIYDELIKILAYCVYPE